MKLHVNDEVSRLKCVLLGTATSSGPVPKASEAYDPKSLEHIQSNTYPVESDLTKEMEALCTVFEKYHVKVFRPKLIENYNQIFARDIAFVIEDKIFKSNVLPAREKELNAISYIFNQIDPDKIITADEDVHFEGGDVILWGDYVFVGTYLGSDYKDYITARTNQKAVDFIQSQFPHKIVKAFSLKKSNTNPKAGVLHLDCCFQPVGVDKAIIYKEGFENDEDVLFLERLFGKENLFEVNTEEMYHMFPNVFSIDSQIVISEIRFKRLNQWLRFKGFTVEEVSYAEVSKQGGLLRCSTMPLIREK